MSDPYSFVFSTPLMKLPITDTIDWSHIPHETHIFEDVEFNRPLTREQMDLLKEGLKNVRPGDANNERDLNRMLDGFTVEIMYRINFSPDFHSLLFRTRDGTNYMIYTLVNFDLNFNPVGFVGLGSFQGPGKLLLHFNKTEIRHATYGKTFTDPAYFLRSVVRNNGETEKIYNKRPIDRRQNIRTVKADPGIVIRDTLGDSIAYYPFGSTTILFSEISDTINVRVNGNMEKSRVMKIITDYGTYLDQIFLPDSSNYIGTVPEVFLFDEPDYNPNRSELSKLSDYYSFSWRINEQYRQTDVREFLEIQNFDLKEIKPKAIKTGEKASASGSGENEPITLNFNNGTSRSLRDTVYYNRELNPHSEFTLYHNEDFPEGYLIKHFYFDEAHFYLLNRENGDTLDVFIDYPHLSPHKKWALSFNTSLYDEDLTSVFVLTELQDKNNEVTLRIIFRNWKIPEDSKVYWLSDSQFVIKAMKVPKASEDRGKAKYSNLMFRIKDFRARP